MNHYIKTYRAVLSISFHRFLSYRMDVFINSVLASGMWTFFNVLSMFIVSSRAKTIFGWEQGELILISALYNIFIGIYAFFLARGISEFSDLVDKGMLDSILLKPLDSQFYTSANAAQYNSLIRLILGTCLAVLISIHYNITVHPINMIYFAFSIVPSMILLYSVLFLINTLIIWSPRTDNITELFYTLRSLGRYPRESFQRAGELVFVFLSPFVIVLSTPSRILLGKATAYDVMELCVAAAVAFAAARMFWKYALRHYTSASS